MIGYRAYTSLGRPVLPLLRACVGYKCLRECLASIWGETVTPLELPRAASHRSGEAVRLRCRGDGAPRSSADDGGVAGQDDLPERRAWPSSIMSKMNVRAAYAVLAEDGGAFGSGRAAARGASNTSSMSRAQ